MNFNFTTKTVIVTGAAHGFGRAITLAFAKLGATVWGCDILGDELAETQALCEGLAGSCEVRTVDVRDKTAVFSFVSEIPTPVNILINNAGGVLGQIGRPLEEVSAEDWHNIFAVNTSAAFYFAQAVAPSMK